MNRDVGAETSKEGLAKKSNDAGRASRSAPPRRGREAVSARRRPQGRPSARAAAQTEVDQKNHGQPVNWISSTQMSKG